MVLSSWEFKSRWRFVEECLEFSPTGLWIRFSAESEGEQVSEILVRTGLKSVRTGLTRNIPYDGFLTQFFVLS